jgi:tRNA G26 N,N-dimethylase Trm1
MRMDHYLESLPDAFQRVSYVLENAFSLHLFSPFFPRLIRISGRSSLSHVRYRLTGSFQSANIDGPFNLHAVDALSGTGLRALRVALEVPFVRLVVANDIVPSSFSVLSENILRHKARIFHIAATPIP